MQYVFLHNMLPSYLTNVLQKEKHSMKKKLFLHYIHRKFVSIKFNAFYVFQIFVLMNYIGLELYR